MGDISALLNLYHGQQLDQGKEVLVLCGLAWFKSEDVEAGAGVYATRYKRDQEKGGEGRGIGVSAKWSNGKSFSSMTAADVSQCAHTPHPPLWRLRPDRYAYWWQS